LKNGSTFSMSAMLAAGFPFTIIKVGLFAWSDRADVRILSQKPCAVRVAILIA